MSEPLPEADAVDPEAALADPDRLGALEASGLADGAPDPAFDRLTRLVQRCLRVPVALVSLVDDHRQVFKSQQGLGEPWCSLGETPLSHSLCQHVVAREAPLVVGDAREHPLVRDNLAVRDLHVVAYLGVPLRTPDGHVIGSLCAIDGVPRFWSEADQEVLASLASVAMGEIATAYRARTEAGLFRDALGISRALLNALFESAPRPTFVLRESGAVAEVNGRALAHLGAVRDALVGRSFGDVLGFTGSAAERLEAAVRDAASGLPSRYVEADAGREAALSVYIRPVPGAPLLLADVQETSAPRRDAVR
ncbi:MAG: GAF domain-containing protein [Bacteroidota bacterium]